MVDYIDISLRNVQSSSMRASEKPENKITQEAKKERATNNEIGWNPEVRYTHISGIGIDNTEMDYSSLTPHKSSYADGFMMSTKFDYPLPATGDSSTVLITWDPFTIADNSDSCMSSK